MVKDLRTFLEEIRRKRPSDLVRVKEEITLEYETTTLVRKLLRKNRRPILFFEKAKEFKMPIVSNLYADRSRLALALDTTADELSSEYGKRETTLIPPKMVESGPVKEVVLSGPQVDIRKLPISIHHQADQAPYLTGGMYVARDPDTGIRNCSFGRLMVVGKNKLRTHLQAGRHLDAIYRKYERKDLPMPCSVFIGHHPALALGSLSIASFDTDELEVMGGMLGEPVRMVRGEVVDCIYPADAEIALEVEIPPGEREDEGPFAEFTGYAAGVQKHHVVNIKAICMRKDTIYHDLIPGTDEHLLPGAIAKEAHFYRVANSCHPIVKRLCVPLSGTGRFHCYVSLDKQMEGQVRNVAMAVLAADIYVKHVIVVDKDIDVYNENEVLWAMATRVQADRDILIIPNCRGSDLDPSALYPLEHAGITAKMIIDATAKPSLEYGAYSRKNRVPPRVEKKIDLEKYIPEQ